MLLAAPKEKDAEGTDITAQEVANVEDEEVDCTEDERVGIGVYW